MESSRAMMPQIIVLLVGQAGSGKSTLLNSMLGKPLLTPYAATLGLEFGLKLIKDGNDEIRLSIWDCAGDKRFAPPSMDLACKAADFCVLFLDRSKSFEESRGILSEEMGVFRGKNNEIVPLLVVTQTEEKMNNVSVEEINQFRQSMKIEDEAIFFSPQRDESGNCPGLRELESAILKHARKIKTLGLSEVVKDNLEGGIGTSIKILEKERKRLQDRKNDSRAKHLALTIEALRDLNMDIKNKKIKTIDAIKNKIEEIFNADLINKVSKHKGKDSKTSQILLKVKIFLLNLVTFPYYMYHGVGLFNTQGNTVREVKKAKNKLKKKIR